MGAAWWVFLGLRLAVEGCLMGSIHVAQGRLRLMIMPNPWNERKEWMECYDAMWDVLLAQRGVAWRALVVGFCGCAAAWRYCSRLAGILSSIARKGRGYSEPASLTLAAPGRVPRGARVYECMVDCRLVSVCLVPSSDWCPGAAAACTELRSGVSTCPLAVRWAWMVCVDRARCTGEGLLTDCRLTGRSFDDDSISYQFRQRLQSYGAAGHI